MTNRIIYGAIGAVVLGALVITWKGGALVGDGDAAIEPTTRTPTTTEPLASVAPAPAPEDSGDGFRSPAAPLPRLPDDIAVEFRPLVAGPDEPETKVNVRRIMIEHYDRFVERAGLSDEQTRAMRRIMADAQRQHAIMRHEMWRTTAEDVVTYGHADPERFDLERESRRIDNDMLRRISFEVLTPEQRPHLSSFSISAVDLEVFNLLDVRDQ
jgi:hypothetical protein